MKLLRAAEQTETATPNGNASTALATPSRGARDVSVIRQRQAAGGFNPPHFHDREEVLILLAGSVTVRSESQSLTLHAGDSLLIPAQIVHSTENTGEADAQWLIVSAAGIRFFAASGEEMQPRWAQ